MQARYFVASAVLLTLLSVPSPTLAQGGYFGRNKVQYQKFDFRVLKTEHFDIYYYPEEDKAAQMAARMAERWYSRLSQILDHELTGRQPIILYASGPHFRQTNTVEGEIGEGTGGVTEAYKRRIVLPFAGPIQATDHVLGHELVHAFQYDITGTNVSANSAGALALPLWFIEGMAEYLSLGPVDPHTAMWMREAARRERLPEVDDLNNPRYFPYRYGHALWAYIGGKYGDDVVGMMLRAAAGRETTYKAAIEEVLKIDSKTLSKEWHAAEFEAYRPIAEIAQMPADFARALVADGNRRRQTQRQPRVEPRRLTGHLLLRKGSVLDRSLPRRREDGEDHQEDHQHGDQCSFREPPVPQFRRRLGPQRSAIHLPWHQRRAIRADHRRRRSGQDRARDQNSGG